MPYTQGVKSCDGSYVLRRVWIAINGSSATVAEGGTHDELRFKWVAHDGRRALDLRRTGFGKRRPCQILVFRWQQHNQSLMSDLKLAPALHRSGTGEPAG